MIPAASGQDIVEQTQGVAQQAAAAYTGLPGTVLTVCVLSGALPFFSGLVRLLGAHTYPGFLEWGFLRVDSYRGGVVRQADADVIPCGALKARGRHVLVVEDIVDTGHTWRAVHDFLRAEGAASVKIATLVNKPNARTVDAPPVSWAAFTTEDPRFLVGYGMDVGGRYRELNGLFALEEGEAL